MSFQHRLMERSQFEPNFRSTEREPCLDDSSTSITNHRWFAHGAHRLLTQESGQCTFRPALLAAKYCFCLVSEKSCKPAHPIRKRSHRYVASWPYFKAVVSVVFGCQLRTAIMHRRHWMDGPECTGNVLHPENKNPKVCRPLFIYPNSRA